MEGAEQYLKGLISKVFPQEQTGNTAFFDNILNDETFLEVSGEIFEKQTKLIKEMKLRWKIENIKEERLAIPNGTVGKPYSFYLDIEKLGWDDIVDCYFEGVEEIGLKYNSRTQVLEGEPTVSGDRRIVFKFKMDEENGNIDYNEKLIRLIINPDPKSLWKDIPSDSEAKFWKEENVAEVGKLGTKNIVVASKRGRSHANVGSFRDDDYAFKHLEETGWSIVAVADGAGSAKYSREGSRIACNHIVEYFEKLLSSEVGQELEDILTNWKEEKDDNGEQRFAHFTKTHLGKAAFSAHKILEKTASENDFTLKDLNTTLIFSLIKKMEFGYVILSFGVGDCPIILLDKDLTTVSLLNTLDVGEYGGGTRFITMPEIFKKEDFYTTRFSFKIVSDFSYLMLMTDGIYDPKFEVEANLENLDKWKEFLQDLEGKNKDNCKVDLDAENEELANQLSKWLDFWSVGNHDDRTLSIIF